MKKNVVTVLLAFSFIFIGSLGTLMGIVTVQAQKENASLIGILNTGVLTDLQSGETISGGTVVALLNNISLLGDDYYCEALVITGANKEGRKYTSEDKYRESNTQSDDYINRKGSFKLEVVKNENGVVSQLKFTQLIE